MFHHLPHLCLPAEGTYRPPHLVDRDVGQVVELVLRVLSQAKLRQLVRVPHRFPSLQLSISELIRLSLLRRSDNFARCLDFGKSVRPTRPVHERLGQRPAARDAAVALGFGRIHV